MRKLNKYISLVVVTGLIIFLLTMALSRLIGPVRASCEVCESSVKGFSVYHNVIRQLIPVQEK